MLKIYILETNIYEGIEDEMDDFWLLLYFNLILIISPPSSVGRAPAF